MSNPSQQRPQIGAPGGVSKIASSIRRHLTYANVVATMALLFAMGGSAVAANRLIVSPAKTASTLTELATPAKSREFGYLITSISQISPRVQTQLMATGRRGPTGPAGAAGAPGSQGPSGLPGAAGPPGTEGIRGREGPEGEPGEHGARGERGEIGSRGETGNRGEKGEAGLSLLSQSEQETLKSILPYIKFAPASAGGKPTIELSGANVQIVDGEVSGEP
jgi:Collagen triple helix repeat (20 copies)